MFGVHNISEVIPKRTQTRLIKMMDFYEATDLQSAIEILSDMFKDMHIFEINLQNRTEAERYQDAEDACIEYMSETNCLKCLLSTIIKLELGDYLHGMQQFLPNPLNVLVDNLGKGVPVDLSVLECSECM